MMDDGTYERGYKLATLRTLLDSAGLLTQVALSAIQVHDMGFFGDLEKFRALESLALAK